MKPMKILALAALVLSLAACAKHNTPQKSDAIVATTPSVTTAARQVLDQEQFDDRLSAAGWQVNSSVAYTDAVALCQAHTAKNTIKNMAAMVKPNAPASMYEVYADAVMATC